MKNSFLQALVDTILPPRLSERVLRELSIEELRTIATTFESAQGLALPYHDPRVTALVWELKYHGNKKAALLAGMFISDVLVAAAEEELGKPLLVPIPMHAARRKARGYNQTELLCEAALRHMEDFFDYTPQALKRIKATTPQQGLAKHIRLRNVQRSMEGSGVVRGKTCVVVDDVMTTGATFEEARRALSAAGAAKVYCIALAHS